MRKDYSYGFEFELADIDSSTKLPYGLKYSKDFDIVNSNGTAIDPARRTHKIGGEVITLPGDLNETLERSKLVFDTFPNASFNHRTVLHCHISYPELKKSLQDLKDIIVYQDQYGMEILEKIWPRDRKSIKLMNARARGFYIYDYCIMPKWKLEYFLNSKNMEEYRNSFKTTKEGRFSGRSIKRYALNTFSVFKHGTIEFRHFFPSKDLKQLKSILEFCFSYIDNAVGPKLPPKDWMNPDWSFPTEEKVKYNHELELCWQNNNYHTNPRDIADRNNLEIINKGI